MTDAKTDVEMVATDSLIPYANNPKEHPTEQVEKIASSIKNYGWDQPIVVDAENEIIKGHGRLEAAKLLELDEVPVIKRTDLSESEKRAARIADNRTAESEWADDDLQLELEQLEEDEYDLELTGFGDDELTEYLEDEEDNDDEQYTDKIKSPVYEPTGEKPDIDELLSTAKFKDLTAQIEAADIESEKKEFLKLTAYRHIVFDYENIAEFYAHENAEVQELMENLALVIVDYDKALEQGFIDFAEYALEGVEDE